jgi:hypothetical protein
MVKRCFGGVLTFLASSLTVYDFNHPYLSLDIPIAFCSFVSFFPYLAIYLHASHLTYCQLQKERQIKVKQYTVSPMEITAKAKVLLKVDKIAELLAATYFYGVPL